MNVNEVMTASPTTIDVSATLHDARELMRNEGLRHLPVMRNGEIAGILSHRDLHFTLAMDVRRDNEILVEDALSPDPYKVQLQTPLKEVARTMSEGRIGCALVCDGNTLCGLFTSVDACRVLSSLL